MELLAAELADFGNKYDATGIDATALLHTSSRQNAFLN